ncbi:bacterial regulatory s, gntR family protein [Mycobacterium avium subsp. avium 2285 (R)]|nr:bacterial regulatory s, gntR family protein [Mycobacterium avium subsp. avium 2285 (R)]
MELGDWLRVDMKAGKPLFDQLRTQVIEGVREGALPPGTRLPTVRELAGQLGVAVNTVARAYRELESAAIIETRAASALSSPATTPPTPRWRPRPASTSGWHAAWGWTRPTPCATSNRCPTSEKPGRG